MHNAIAYDSDFIYPFEAMWRSQKGFLRYVQSLGTMKKFILLL